MGNPVLMRHIRVLCCIYISAKGGPDIIFTMALRYKPRCICIPVYLDRFVGVDGWVFMWGGGEEYIICTSRQNVLKGLWCAVDGGVFLWISVYWEDG